METKSVVIYCRVSSKKQVSDGNGLDSQERKCRNWCSLKGYKVLRVFKEEGVSGGKKDRPAFNRMLDFLTQLKEPCIVLVEDLNRWARETINHFLLKQQIMALGHSLQSVNMTLEDTEESELMETMSASISQYERKKNAKRAKTCMQENAKQGFWILATPIGYQRKRVNKRVHCIRLEPTASYIEEALEGFASGKFLTQKDVLNFLKDKDLRNFNDKPIKVSFNTVKTILENKKYTSIFPYEKWDIAEQQWAIEPIISIQTYTKIQERLHKKKNVLKERKYVMDDMTFPLRRWVRCANCGKPLTGSKSRNKLGNYYPYYHCRNKDCSMKGKGIREKDIHQEFEALLKSITPQNQLIELTRALIEEKCNNENKVWKQNKKQLEADIKAKIEEQQKCFDILISQSDNPSVCKLCSDKILKLDIDIALHKEQLNVDDSKQEQKLKEFSSYALDFMQNPVGVWQVGDYQQKRCVLNLCFSNPISYDRKEKFGTPELSPIFNILNDSWCSNMNWRTRRDSNPRPSASEADTLSN